MTREEALQELRIPLTTQEQAARNKRFVAKKLGITVSELERLITLPVMPHENFANSQALYRINRRFRKIVGSSR